MTPTIHERLCEVIWHALPVNYDGTNENGYKAREKLATAIEREFELKERTK